MWAAPAQVSVQAAVAVLVAIVIPIRDKLSTTDYIKQ